MPTDKERLDWLDKVNRNLNAIAGTEYGWKFEMNHNRSALTDHNLPVLTVREAIDAAMAELLKTALLKEQTLKDDMDVHEHGGL